MSVPREWGDTVETVKTPEEYPRTALAEKLMQKAQELRDLIEDKNHEYVW